MNEPWALYAATFVLVAIAAQLFQSGAGNLARRRSRKRQRADALRPLGASEEMEALRRRTSWLGGLAIAARLLRLVRQSGTTLSVSGLLLVGLVGTGAMFVMLPAPENLFLRLATALLSFLAALWIWLRVKRGRRIARFGQQLPDAIDVIVRSLRAGHPLAVSLGLVARDSPEPAASEFALLVDEMNYGRSLPEAMNNLYLRVGHPELRFFVAAIAIASQTGGNLGEILSRLSRMLRDRFRLVRRVRALSAEGRFSGYALSLLPFLLFGAIQLVSASYYADFWRSPVANTVIAVSFGLLLVGNLAIYRLVNFKV